MTQENQTPTSTLSELRTAAEKLAGRPLEVEKLKDGKYIVMWMCFEVSPPKPGDTEEEALSNFIDKMLQLEKPEGTL